MTFALILSAVTSALRPDRSTESFTDRKDFNTYLSIHPMSEVKNKWLSGLTFEYGAWFCNNDVRSPIVDSSGTALVQVTENGCSRYRIQDHGDGGRQTIFDSGAGSVGNGLHVAHGPGVVWAVGPYTFRAMGSFQRSEDIGGTTGKKRAQNFLLGHDLYLWSPKGFLTGSSTEVGSVLVGTHFERVDMSCGDRVRGCGTSTVGSSTLTSSAGTISPLIGGSGSINGGQYRRVRVLLREWDLWYVIAPRMSVGANVLWYDSSNLRSTFNNAANNLGLCHRVNNTTTTNCRVGGGGNWTDVMLNWRYTF